MATDFATLNAQALTESFMYNAAAKARDYLWTEEYFRQFPILIIDDREIGAMVDIALSGLNAGPTGKVGLSIVINPLLGGRAIPNNPAAFSEGARMVFEVVEIPEINRSTSGGGSGQPGQVVAEMLAAAMQNFACGESGWTNIQFYAAQNYLLAPVPAKDGKVALVRSIEMLTNGGLNNTTARVATPVITRPTEDDASITCATAGAAIYYTTDGTTPLFFITGSASNVGTLYSGALISLNNATVRARAFKDAMRASLTTQANPI